MEKRFRRFQILVIDNFFRRTIISYRGTDSAQDGTHGWTLGGGLAGLEEMLYAAVANDNLKIERTAA
jgi:hypothetical protein